MSTGLRMGRPAPCCAVFCPCRAVAAHAPAPHQVFELLGYLLNTIIFVIAGLQLGQGLSITMAASTNGLSQRYLWWAVGSIYFIVLVARGAAMCLFYPLLKRLGTQCTWQEAVVMWWGGLRGAVGLALALAIHHTKYDGNMWGDKSHDDILLCRDQPTMILMVSAMVVVMTVIVNGITMAPLMKRLRLTDVDDERTFMLQQAWAKIEADTKRFIDSVEKNNIKHFRRVDWETVHANEMTPPPELAHQSVERKQRAAWLQCAPPSTHTNEMTPRVTSAHTNEMTPRVTAERSSTYRRCRPSSSCAAHVPFTRANHVRARRVINMESMAYLGQFEGGHLGSEAYYILENFMSVLRARADRESLEGEQLSHVRARATVPAGVELGFPVGCMELRTWVWACDTGYSYGGCVCWVCRRTHAAETS